MTIDAPPGWADPLHVAVGYEEIGATPRPNYTRTDLIQADRNRLIGAVKTAHLLDLVTVDDDARSLLDELASENAASMVTIESRGAAAVRSLAAEGVDIRVLKGVAVAHLDYDDPLLRPFGDIDLLVRGQDMPTAIEVLRATGFRRHFEEPYPGYDQHVGKGVAMEDDAGNVIDLHRTLALGYYGNRLPVDTLWTPGERFVVARTELAALPRVARFVHAALHMALAPVRPDVYALDLCAISGADPINPEEVLACARTWGCVAPLFEAINIAAAKLGDDIVESQLRTEARRYRPALRDRIMMSTYEGRLSSSHARSFAAVVSLRDPSIRRWALRMLLRSRGHVATS